MPVIATNYAGNAFSAAFLAAVAKPMVGYTAKLYCNGSALTCDIMRLDLTLGSCADPQGDSDFAVGEVYTSYLEGTLYNVSGSLVGKELDVCIGVDIGSGVYEYAQVAAVVVTSAKTRAGVTAIQASGKLAYEATNTPIGTSGELAPSAVASAIATATGLTVTIGAFASTSTTVTIESGMTCRAALGAIAKRLGGYACETNTGGVAVVPFDGTATYTLDPDTSTQLPDVEEADFAVDGITVRADEADYTSGTGRVVIEDASATATTEAVTWGNIDGYAFRPGSANTAVLDPRITPFDVLAVTHEGNTVNLPARGIAATYDGGYFGTFSAVGLTDAGDAALMRGPLGAQVDLAQRAASEALEVAEATGQHFWPYTDGVHITGPETEDEFLAAEAASFPDYDPDTKPYHNILLNSLGILLRTALNNLVSITRSAIAFYDGLGNNASNIVASFGSDGAQIGLSGESHVEINYQSMQLVDQDGDTYFQAEDLRNSSGLASFYSGNIMLPRTQYDAGIQIAAVTELTIWSGDTGRAISSSGYTVSGSTVTLTETTTAADTYWEVWYTTADGAAKAYTFGVRISPLTAGASSLAEGYSRADGAYSHSEGYGSRAMAVNSHAEGSRAYATGANSHAQNSSTRAASDNQTAMGRFNIEDANDTYALIIGNGTADDARSNALAVKWDGAAIMQAWAGVIQMFAGSTPPAGWLLCDGSAVSRTDYATLFAAIGTTWGVGDGSTTFNLPDLRGRAPIGAGTGSGLTARTLGGKLGSEYIQAHTHSFTQPTITSKYKNDGTTGGSARRYVQDGTSSSTTLATASGGAVGAVSGATTGSAGNMQPSAVVNFIIHTGKF